MTKKPESDDLRAQVNSFAMRMFRDTADNDYMAARVSYRAHLYQPFRWQAIHCLEKYAKGVLLLNRVSSKGLSHQVLESLQRLADEGPFAVSLSDESKTFIEHLEQGAQYRYYEISFTVNEMDLYNLDRAVSELRRYCRPLNHTLGEGDERINFLNVNLRQIEEANGQLSTETLINSGVLETVLEKKAHPSRQALVWKNLFFNRSGRKKAKFRQFFAGGNAPLHLHPELVHAVEDFIILSKDLKDQWKAEAQKREAGKP